jgi:hypothetical protein
MKRALFTIVLLVFAREATARVCLTVPLKRAYKGATYMFIGEVVPNEELHTNVHVLEWLKGSGPSDVRVNPSDNEGINFGADAGVWLFDILRPRTWDGVFVIDPCTYTGPLKTPYLRRAPGMIRRWRWWWRLPISNIDRWWIRQHLRR